jgi:hypothetical protein
MGEVRQSWVLASRQMEFELLYDSFQLLEEPRGLMKVSRPAVPHPTAV